MLPQRITTPSAWKGSEIDYRSEMLHVLSSDQIDEIDAALRICGERDIPEISVETFPLPVTGAFLTKLRDELFTGRGAVLLRGLPRHRYTADEMARIYVGLGAHLGQPLAQSYHGELLGSVIDVSDIEEKVRGYRAGGPQHFHVDGSACDIVSLMCLRSAKSGGASRLVSVAAVHNALLDTRPDLLEVLYDGYYHRYHERDGAHTLSPIQSQQPIPVFSQRDGYITCNIDGGMLRYAVQQGGVRWTPKQIEAYDEMQRIARTEEYFLDMNFEDGDIQFVNNRALMHGRTGYEDHQELERRRHLLRLWLHVPEWPARAPNQIFLNLDDCRHWLRQRQPDMEFPAAYLADMAARQAKRRQENSMVTPEKTSSSYKSAGDWALPQPAAAE